MRTLVFAAATCFMLTACGGSSGTADPSTEGGPLLADESDSQSGGSGELPLPAIGVEQARYRVTIENDWGVDDFPQGFPDDAHLSLIGGATHAEAVSFWEFGEPATPGIEDMAETGRIDILLADEVVPAIENGTADSQVAIREYTGAKVAGVPGTRVFEIAMHRSHPLVTLVTMLGPSPDWFVGVSGERMYDEQVGWLPTLLVELPLLDGGTKTDITPVMGGPDIIPGEAISYVAYQPSTGVYLPSMEPQIVGRLRLERIE